MAVQQHPSTDVTKLATTTTETRGLGLCTGIARRLGCPRDAGAPNGTIATNKAASWLETRLRVGWKPGYELLVAIPLTD